MLQGALLVSKYATAKTRSETDDGLPQNTHYLALGAAGALLR